MNGNQENSLIVPAGQLTNGRANRPQSIERSLELLNQKPRVFQFPDSSVGRLILRPKDPQKEYLKFFSGETPFFTDSPEGTTHGSLLHKAPPLLDLEAKGVVTIPGNHLVGFIFEQLNQDTLKCLSQLPANALDALCLSDNHILTNELEFIENLESLRILCLDCTNIDDKSFEHVRAFKKLEKLTVSDNNLSYRGLQALEALPELQFFQIFTSLEYERYPFDDETLEVLGSLKNLKEIYLEQCEITDRGVAALTNLKHLHSLDLQFNSLSDACTESLKEMKSLSRLDLSISGITDKAVENLAQLQNLTILDLWGTEVSKEAATWLYERLPNCLQLIWKEGYINRKPGPKANNSLKPTPSPEEKKPEIPQPENASPIVLGWWST